MGGKTSKGEERERKEAVLPLNVSILNMSGEEVFKRELIPTMTLLGLKKALAEEVGGSSVALKLICGSETLQPDLMPLGEMLEGNTELTFIRVNVRRVRFQSLAWRGGRADSYNDGCGLSSEARAGDTLRNAKDETSWVMHVLAEGVKFESESQPGLCICNAEDGTGKLLEGNGQREVFREIPALNGEEDSVTLESLAQPGYYLCHRNGTIYFDSLGRRTRFSDTIFRNDASLRLQDCD
eukprot:s3901_g2.t1